MTMTATALSRPPQATDSLRGLGIAHLIECDGPGGAERMIAALAREQRAAGARVVVVVPSEGEGWLEAQLDGADVAVEHYRLERPLSRAAVRHLAALFSRHGVRVAHCHEFAMAVHGAWAARRAGIPHVATMHGGRYYADRWRRRLALRTSAGGRGRLVAVSTDLARRLARDLWLPPARVTVIPNGIQAARVHRFTLRAELGLVAGDRLALSVGNLYPVKGHRYAVEALARIADRHPELHLAIAGRGELREPLLALARSLGVGGRVHLLGLREDVPDLLAASDLFLMPSLSEGLPLALLEAMAAGCPVVASAVGEIPGVLEHGAAGTIVPPGDAAALARALDALLTSPRLARSVAARAEERVRADYGIARMAERYTALYAGLLRVKT